MITCCVGQYFTYFMQTFGGVHVTTTFVRQLLESDVAAHGTTEERKCWLYLCI